MTSSDAGVTSSSIISLIVPSPMPTLSPAPSLMLSPVSTTSGNLIHRPFAGGLLSEAAEPQGRTRINWKLATDLPITSVDEAVEKLRGYACRWKIELFHKVLKSGCRAEAARLRTAERLTKLVAV